LSLRGCVRGFAVVAALCLLVRWGMAQPAQNQVTIADVFIFGNRTIPTSKIMNFIISCKPGQTFSTGAAQEDLRRLAGSRMFKDIRPIKTEATTDGRVNVIIEVVEHPNLVREVIYKHAKHGDIKDLEAITKVRRGMPLDTELNRIVCFDLQEHLKRQGFYFATVTLEEGYESGHDRVIFNISEGRKLRIGKIDFVGQNELATQARLLTQIDSRKAFLQSFGGTFNDELIKEDAIKLEQYYKNNGYQHVSVSRELHFHADYRFVDVTFHIQEGARFRVYDRTVEGTKNIPREQFESVVMVKPGEYYNGGVVQTDVKYLTDYAGWRGFQADVKSIVTEVPDRPGEVRVQYVVEDKPISYVGDVIIVGNTVTQDRVIRRMLGLYPGQVLRYPELKIAEAQLSRLGIFEMNPEQGIRPTVQALDNPSPFKDILVKVQETRTGSLMLGAGVNSNNGVVGSIVLNEKNFDIFRFPTSFADFFDGKAFRGAGQEFRIEAVPGTVLQRYTVSLREPMLFDLPYSALWSAYYRTRIFNEYSEERTGTRETLGHQFTKEIGASVGFRLENVQVNNIALGAPSDYQQAYGPNLVAAPNLTIAWDTRDSFLKPTEGGRVEFMYEQVFGTNTFPIFNLEGSRYFTTWQRPDGSGKHVIYLHSQLSWEGTNAPVYERFFGGGYMSIRGFQFRGVGPETNGFMTGGTFQWLNSIEYQIPLKANDNLYFVTFVDSGTVESRIGIHDYRVSAGFGLRITVPMMGPVPIALDFGFPIVRASGDQTQLFSFWVGLYR
jgi:outer membrane protein assembly complex protein YaeT